MLYVIAGWWNHQNDLPRTIPDRVGFRIVGTKSMILSHCLLSAGRHSLLKAEDVLSGVGKATPQAPAIFWDGSEGKGLGYGKVLAAYPVTTGVAVVGMSEAGLYTHAVLVPPSGEGFRDEVERNIYEATLIHGSVHVTSAIMPPGDPTPLEYESWDLVDGSWRCKSPWSARVVPRDDKIFSLVRKVFGLETE